MKKGFTLMEVLVYLTTLSIIITAVFSFVLWAVRSNTKARAMREVTDNARRTMEILTHEIKEAKSVYVPTTTSSQLSLETTKYLPAGEKTTYIDFYLCGNQLCLKKESQNPIALTSERVRVSNLVFERIVTGETPSVEVNLEIDHLGDKPEYTASLNLKSTVSLRSY